MVAWHTLNSNYQKHLERSVTGKNHISGKLSSSAPKGPKAFRLVGYSDGEYLRSEDL
jgi:hypothetical protein